ncbi:protein indeterminate-domain 12-like [Euphorbia lathyris]|uniref:protein indeterminate-domain 12-like n=1 Tax=Euphorbia lathyris TaxID=212925 RepID=UPI0033142C00
MLLKMDENMSNLTSEISATFYSQQSFASTNEAQPPLKKKRSLPGNPDPDSEVVALSPKSLLATNRFICEICNKGFQRDQNLQLHRRGHNLPWKLKQRTKNEVIKKKVYVCPETTCVHHHPSRALGDLTGIKKHFFRKHGEKKWKCEKCSKRYAVQSDWKAHSKICGTREYRCDCGTLFSRRDSFITHRAFCDTLAEESVRTSAILSPRDEPTSIVNLQALTVKREQESHNLFNQITQESNFVLPWLGGPSPALDDHHHKHKLPPYPQCTAASSPHMSATALLQKAAEMGVKESQTPGNNAGIIRPHQTHMSELSSTSVATSGLGLCSREDIGSGFGSGFGNKAATMTTSSSDIMNITVGGAPSSSTTTTSSLAHDMISSLSSANGFDDDEFHGFLLNPQTNTLKFSTTTPASKDGFTRDFLGLEAFPDHKDFFNIAALYGHQSPWH